jgi:hypothetical protein
MPEGFRVKILVQKAISYRWTTTLASSARFVIPAVLLRATLLKKGKTVNFA